MECRSSVRIFLESKNVLMRDVDYIDVTYDLNKNSNDLLTVF